MRLDEIDAVLKCSKYSGGYSLDHKPERFNMGVRQWYLLNETISVRTPPIRLPAKESDEVSHLTVYTQAVRSDEFKPAANEIAREAGVCLYTTPTHNTDQKERQITKFTFSIEVKEINEMLNGIKSIERTRGLLYPYLYGKQYYQANAIKA